MRNYGPSERNSHFWSPSVVAFKRFFSFRSSSISEIKSEVGKQLQLQTGGGEEGIDFMANCALCDQKRNPKFKGLVT